MFDGVLLVDKPTGITSFDIIRKMKKKLPKVKIGHAGTLDPDASGLMVLVIGHSTKLSQYLLSDEKTYTVELKLGCESDTYDASGEISFKSDRHVPESEFSESLRPFIGTIEQKVPLFSAVKVAGKKLYDYARSGQTVQAPTKRVTVASIDIMNYRFPEAQLKVECSKGTYMRSLVHDIGQVLGVGALTTHIRRLRSGRFQLEDAVSLESLLASSTQELSQHVWSIEETLSDWCLIEVPAPYVERVRNGHGLTLPQMRECRFMNGMPPLAHSPVLMKREGGGPLAIGSFLPDFSVKTVRVLGIDVSR